MISGDYRSAVHEAAAEPWKIDVVVRDMLSADEERGRAMQQYASEALRSVSIGAGDALTLGEMVEWCWMARGVHDDVVPGLAWAVVMKPTESPSCWGAPPAFLFGDFKSAWMVCKGYAGNAWALCLWPQCHVELYHHGERRGGHGNYYNEHRRQEST